MKRLGEEDLLKMINMWISRPSGKISEEEVSRMFDLGKYRPPIQENSVCEAAVEEKELKPKKKAPPLTKFEKKRRQQEDKERANRCYQKQWSYGYEDDLDKVGKRERAEEKEKENGDYQKQWPWEREDKEDIKEEVEEKVRVRVNGSCQKQWSWGYEDKADKAEQVEEKAKEKVNKDYQKQWSWGFEDKVDRKEKVDNGWGGEGKEPSVDELEAYE